MRKRGLPYVLAAMMLIGSTGIGGNYVRADEPAVTEEGEVETTETDEIEAPTEETTEEVIEETTEEIKEESPEEITRSMSEKSTKETDEESYIITENETDAEDSPIAVYRYWYKDFDYELTLNPEPRLILKEYKGTKKELTIPGTFTIDDIKYKVYLQSMEDERNYYYGKSIFAQHGITKITFMNGLELPEDSSHLFADCESLESIVFEGVDTSKVKNMSYMFAGCENLKELDLSGFDTSNVTDMKSMFMCVGIDTLDLSNFNTKKVKNFTCMFWDCIIKELNISKFDFSSIESDEVDLFGDESFIDIIYTPIRLTKTIDRPFATYYVDYPSYESTIDAWAFDDPMEKYVHYCDAKGDYYYELPCDLNESIRIAIDQNLALGKGWADIRGTWIYYEDFKQYSGKTILAKLPVKGIEGNDLWYATSDGTVDKDFTGIAPKNTNGHLRFARNGVMDLKFTGLALDPKNHWCFVRDGVPDLKFSGIAQTTEGKWYYCNKGRIDTSFTNMIAKCTNGKYYYVVKGRPTSKFNGIAYCPETKNWYYCTNGRIDFKFSGKVAPCTNGNWYYVTKGRIDYTFTGIAPGTDGKKYYVVKGLVDRTFTGPYTYNKITYNVVNGVVKN